MPVDPWTHPQNRSNPWTVQGIPGRLATMIRAICYIEAVCPFINRLNRFWWVLIRVYTEPASVWHVFVLKD